MNAASYLEWCELAGLYLGNVSHYDRYQSYAPQISAAGLNTVIVGDFLHDTGPLINVSEWRSYSVYEMGSQQDERVAMTARALEAIGATRLAAAVREAKSNSPFDAIMNLDFTNLTTGMKSLKDLKLPDLLGHLQKSIDHVFPADRQSQGIAEVSGDKSAHPEYESRDQVEQLLEQYVADHQAELQADLNRHGDPRLRPGYTREGRLAELDAERQRRNDHDAQLQLGKELTENVRTIEKLLAQSTKVDPKKMARKVDGPRRNILRTLKRFKQRTDPRGAGSASVDKELVPELAEALATASTLIASRPDLFAVDLIGDDRLKQRLKDLGGYDAELSHGQVFVQWDQPAGFASSWTKYSLTLIFPKGKKRALQSLLDAAERLRKRLPALDEQWRTEVLEHFQIFAGQMEDWELEDYELGDDGEPLAASILAHAGGGSICLEALTPSGDEIDAQARFGVDWDEEHGLEVRWEDEPEVSMAAESTATSPVRWSDDGPAITEAAIVAFEQQIGASLPDDYQSFLMEHNGGRPVPNHLVVKKDGQKIAVDVERFFSLTTETTSAESLQQARQQLGKAMAKLQVIPIASVTHVGPLDPFAPTAVALVLRGKRKGHVLLWREEFLRAYPEQALGEEMIAGMLLDMQMVAAKSLNDLWAQFREKPAAALPDWLQFIRQDQIASFTSWLRSGGKLNASYQEYGAPQALTVLDYLVQEGSEQLLQELLQEGAIRPQHICDGWLRSGARTARFRELMKVLPPEFWQYALRAVDVWQHPDVWEQLADAGVDFTAPINDEGTPPLHLAVDCGNQEAVRWLMAHGADPHQVDRYDRDAFIYAERGPGFECLPLLEGRQESAPTREAHPDAAGISTLIDAARQLPQGTGLVLTLQIKSPPVTRIEKAYYDQECHYELSIDVRGDKVTFRDMNSARQDYLYAAKWPTFLFAPILQWPALTPLWDTLEVREFDCGQAMKKRKYAGVLRDDLVAAARSAIEQALDAEEAAARGIRLRK